MEKIKSIERQETTKNEGFTCRKMRSWDKECVFVDIRRRHWNEEVSRRSQIAIYALAFLDARVGRVDNSSKSPYRDEAVRF
jgi:hypothetical protein